MLLLVLQAMVLSHTPSAASHQPSDTEPDSPHTVYSSPSRPSMQPGLLPDPAQPQLGDRLSLPGMSRAAVPSPCRLRPLPGRSSATPAHQDHRLVPPVAAAKAEKAAPGVQDYLQHYIHQQQQQRPSPGPEPTDCQIRAKDTILSGWAPVPSRVHQHSPDPFSALGIPAAWPKAAGALLAAATPRTTPSPSPSQPWQPWQPALPQPLPALQSVAFALQPGTQTRHSTSALASSAVCGFCTAARCTAQALRQTWPVSCATVAAELGGTCEPCRLPTASKQALQQGSTAAQPHAKLLLAGRAAAVQACSPVQLASGRVVSTPSLPEPEPEPGHSYAGKQIPPPPHCSTSPPPAQQPLTLAGSSPGQAEEASSSPAPQRCRQELVAAFKASHASTAAAGRAARGSVPSMVPELKRMTQLVLQPYKARPEARGKPGQRSRILSPAWLNRSRPSPYLSPRQAASAAAGAARQALGRAGPQPGIKAGIREQQLQQAPLHSGKACHAPRIPPSLTMPTTPHGQQQQQQCMAEVATAQQSKSSGAGVKATELRQLRSVKLKLARSKRVECLPGGPQPWVHSAQPLPAAAAAADSPCASSSRCRRNASILY